MNAPDRAGAKSLREWWMTPPRPGLRRFIHPWAYRHLRFFGVTRVVGGSIAAIAGFICLSYHVYGWAGFFLVVAALALAAGCWYLAIDRSADQNKA